MDASRDDAAASDLFKKLLSPPPTAEDVRLLMEESGHLMTLKDLRNINEPRCGVPPSFVVNRKAAQELCAQLEPHVFTTLSYPFQMRILVLMDIGLAAGVCSAVRLRLGCESNTQPMSLVRRLLDLLKKVATRTGEEGIMQILGRVLRVVCYARVKVDELKWILQELCSPSATTKPLLFALGASQADINDDVEIYCRSTSTGHLPRLPTVRSIFNFDGVGSGLVLPEMPWPFAQEYQFSFWERLEQGCGFIADTTDESATRRAHLVTFTTRGGAGVDYFLEGSHLFVSVADGRSSGQVQARVVDIGDLGLNRGKWHTLTIVHKRSSALLFNKDQLRIYVDEEEAFSGNVPFPRQVNEPLTHCSVGWDLDGQTSGVLIFSRAADRGVTAEILKRLADHTESSPADLNLSQDLTNNSRWDILRAKPLSSRCQILAALMPDRTVNGLCLETHHGYHAKLREHRTHAWTVWLAQDVIRSIGGTPSLLPMASILLTDSPVCTGENVDTVIFLMLSFLVGNDTNQHDFLCARAMGVLEVLLRSAPEGAFASAGAHTVMALEGMYLCCGSRWSSLGSQGQSGSVEHPVVTQAETNSLQQQVASDLLTNFVLWARAPPEMQFGLAARVLDLVRYDPGHFRSFLPVEKILTSLSICYPDRIPGDGPQTVNVGGRLDAMLDEDSDHEGANPAEAHQERKAWTTMARRERQHMRGCLWEVIRLLLNEGTTQQDGTAIVHLLASCADAKVVCELVQMLGAVMRQLKPPPGIFRAMETASRRCTHHLESRVVDRDVTSNGLAAGFVPLVLQRCVRADGVSEDLRVAGLRAASVFMVRSNKNGDVPANPSGGTTSRDRRQSLTSETGTGQVSSEVTVEALSKTVFPLLSEALSRDRHHLGETTYVALLEMALLVDERDVPWCDQIHVTNIVKNVSMQQGFSGDTSDDQHKRKQRRGSTTSLEATSSLWWDLQEDTNDGRINGLIIDDTQLLHNILPLALIMQHLPNMATSVQVYSHSELLLMLKVNEGNRQKLYELSHANSDVFWGLWERYLFIMMGPVFARSQGLPASRSSNIQDVEERRVEVSHDSISGEVTTDAERAREGDYFMVVSQGTLSIPRMVISTMHKLTSHTQEVLELYALVLERAMLFDDEGYREIELVASLQPSIPRGDVAARLLLAQLALRLGRQGIPGLSAAGAKGSMHKSTSKSGGFPPSRATPSMSNWSEPVDDMVQPLWNNVVQLAFVAANLVSDDISTITGGLFSEDDDLYRDEHLTRDEPIHDPGLEARRLSSAASGSPVLLCSSPDVDASVALSMRVLSLFCVSSEGSAIELDKICTSQSTIPSQGPLMWPLLRLSLFLLVRLHPCTQSARENASFFGALVRTLVSPEWCDWCAERDCEPADSDDMCMVVLAHVHAALLRLHAQMSAMVDLEHRRLPLASDSGTAGMASVERLAELSESSGQHFENTMFDCLERLTRRQTDLLNRRLGERVTSALGEEVTAEVRRRRLHEETELAWAQPDGEKGHIRVSWDDVARNLAWMGNSFVMMSSSKSSAMGSGERTSLPEACVRSLKAAEELESRAVQAGRECFQEWQTVVNRAVATLFVTPDLQAGASDMLLKQEVLRAARDQAEKTEALSAARKERRLVEARQRLQGFKRNFGAAWSPWAKGVDPASKFEPMGWEISSHKDQRMRQMLLVPVDRNVRHAEASYYGKNTSPGALSEESSRSGNLTGDAALLEVPALRPSASLLAGDDGFIDDEEDEPAAQDELDSSISADADADADANHASSEGKDSEDISELEAGHQIWHDFLSTTSLSDGVNEDILQHARGTWTVTMVFRESSVQGTLYVFAECLVIRSFREPSEGKNQSASSSASSLARHYGKTWYWQLRRLTQLHLRRYLLSPQAVELFWADSPEIFLAFEDVQGRQNFTRVLRKQHVPMLPFTTLHGTLHPRKVLKESRLTELWRRRQISNFRYIMELNVIAGRSYNDVTQYPVFPWVLSDYSSDTLDLGKAQSFRDLRKPIGAINENRRELFMERYSTFDDELVPKFMYGTHYSSAGVVLHYLVRQEPFTSLHIQLQDGSFDCPDRLFQDLQQCWDGCVDGNNLSDVKELTPEFFYLPEMFLNTNKLPLGELQGKTGVVNDVRLPPWAKDAHDFVRLHRLALESEYVSRNLHHWIDLVFGYKQRGQEAVKAANVFYYLTYEGAVDLSQVNDPQRREAMELQIRHFGQTPSQLLLEPHPARLPLEECVLPLFSSRSMLERLRVYTPRYWPRNAERRPALLVHCTKERLLCVDASLRVTTWAFSGLPNGRGQPFTLEPGRSVCIPTGSLHMSALYLNDIRDSSGRRVPGAESKDGETEDTELSPRCISRVHSCLALKMGTDGDPDSILSCGYWDHAIRCHSLDASAKLVLGARGTGGHHGAINCLCVAEGGSLLVTGGQDATCRVWVVGNAPMASALSGLGGLHGIAGSGAGREELVCVNVLYGHEAPVVSLAVSEELDATVSGATDGRIVVHCLKDGSYVRQFLCTSSREGNDVKASPEASQLTFSCHGDVVVHSWTDLSLHRFSINGAHLATGSAPAVMNCLMTVGGGEYLLAGGQDGTVGVYALYNLLLVHTINLHAHGGITCMSMSVNSEYLLVGSEDGEVSVVTDTKTRLRMLDLAMRNAFVG